MNDFMKLKEKLRISQVLNNLKMNCKQKFKMTSLMNLYKMLTV